jgi:hypothetical protein
MLKRLMVCFLVLFPAAVFAQTDDNDPPPLTETFDGRGRLADITLDYPDDWHTLGGIPVNRLISFNILSSVRVGIRNQIEPGEEAIVLAIAGGRVDRWGDIEAGATPEDVLTAFIERLGDGGDGFGGDPDERDSEDFELVVDELAFNGYDAVRMRFVAADNAPEPAEDEIDGDFVAYAVLLDDNRFIVVLTLTSEFTFEEAQPTIEGILGTLTYSAD